MIKYLLSREVFYMPYFNIHKLFLVDNYELPLKEKEKIDKFLQILDDSGIAKFFLPIIRKDKSKGGRPTANPFKLFAGIALGFSERGGSLREIEKLMNFDIRFRYLMDQETVNASTMSRFCNNYVVA